ncbi:MAG TPA: hypothetical protein VLJ59_03090 [Mycobacteriales bacterium]|nr:hypothetical protein [Mycobacteriales bacterium]
MTDSEMIRQLRTSSDETRQHVAVNDPARGAYRRAAVVFALLLASTGLVALVVSMDVPVTGRFGHGLAGLTVNRATGVLLVVLAGLTAASAILPGNRGAVALTGAGMLMLLTGLFFLTFSRTDANIVAFSVVDVSALWVVAMGVLWCGLHLWEAADDEPRTLAGR